MSEHESHRDEEGQDAEDSGVGSAPPSDESRDGEDDREALVREIESDPASNPEDPKLREIKGG